MRNKFNKEKYNIKRLEVRDEDIERNKCTHEIFDKESGECAICGTEVNPNAPWFNEDELISAVDTVIDHLETMKMIVNSCMSKKEIRAAQEYFDMIPLLNNIDTLYNICMEEFNNANLDIVGTYNTITYDEFENIIKEKSEGKNDE